MELTEAIAKRRSFHSFTEEPLGAEEIDALVDFLSALDPPGEGIDWNFDTLPYLDMVRISSREPALKAPHYLVLRAERKLFSLQMCGYIGEMGALWLTTQGIGSCWLGNSGVDPAQDFHGSLPFVAAIAFGRSDEPFRPEAAPADRLPAEKTCFGRYEERKAIMDAARLAPSYLNRQPCAFVSDDRNCIHIYRKKVFLNNPVLSYAQCLDAGAAMAHLELAAKANGFPQARWKHLSNEPAFKRMIYQATLELEPKDA